MTATRPPGYDDRSAAPVEASRRGAHRARPKAIAAILPVIAGVAVVLLVIGAVYTVVGGGSDTPTGTTAGRVEAGDEDVAQPSASAGEKDDADKGDGEAGAGETAEPETSEGADAGSGGGGGSKVDKSIELIVLNSLNVSGLAAEWKTELEGKDWTVVETGNSRSKDLSVTKVYYPDADMKPTANGVRKALGMGEISEEPGLNEGKITVVLGQDAQ